MNFKKLKMMGLTLGMGAILVACGNSDEHNSSLEATSGSATEESKEINLAYVEWDTEVASTNVVGKV